MRVRVLLFVVSAAVLGFAPAPLPKRERQGEHPNDLTGVWRFVRCETNGVLDDPSTFTNYRIEIRDTEIHFMPNGERRGGVKMVLDPKASPPSFTWSLEGRVYCVGSYRLVRGELTMVFAVGSRLEDRPKDLTNGPHRYVLRRVSR